MGFSFAAGTREVLEQVVREPRFRALTTLPVFAWQEIALILGAYLLFGVGTWAWLQGYLPLPAMWLVNGFAIYVSFTPLHDATHRTVSSNRRFNDLLGTLSSLLLLPGITTRIYRYLHLEHHRYAGDTVKDPDDPFVTAEGWRLVFVLLYPEILWSVFYISRWRSRPASERVEFVGNLVFYALFHLFWLTSPYALEFFLAWMIPQRIGLGLVTWFFAHIQHPAHVTWEAAPLQTTVRVVTNPVATALLLGQAVHCLHHFAPSVPWYRYHRAWNLGRHLFETQDVPTRTLFSPSASLKLPADARSDWRTAEVTAYSDVATDVRSYTLKRVDGSDWPHAGAGAHIDVQVDDDTVRQYSLCGDPGVPGAYQVAIKKEVDGRGGSLALHEKLVVGTRLSISPPRNNFPLSLDYDRYFLIAAGIGITPLVAMAHELHRHGKALEIHCWARTENQAPLSEYLSQQAFRSSIQWHFSEANGRKPPAAVIPGYKPGYAIYVCGPRGFMADVIAVGERNDWPAGAMFSESFVRSELDASSNTAFQVTLARSGVTLNVPADRFLIDVLHDNGYPVMCSCTQGICGSCITPVLEGEPEHRDAILTDAERAANDRMCVCVGRSRSERLVLDL